jgi:transposase
VASKSNKDSDLNAVVDELGRLFDAGHKDVLLGAVRSVLSAARTENLLLTQKVVDLTRKVYGRSSERIDPNQLRLALADMREQAGTGAASEHQADAELPSAPPEPTRKKPRKGKQNGRRALPADLPREEVRLTPTLEQQAGKGTMTKVGEERSEVLEYEPARFKVIVYVRETWSNATGQIVTASAPNKVIEKGLPGPGLLTQVTLSKYKDHCPLARQTRIYRRDGVELHRNTLVDWIAAVAFLLEPIANRIYELAMLAHALQVDDTRLDVLDRSKKKNIKRAHLWVMVGDHTYIAFKYTPDWTAEKAEAFLGSRIGWMQVDGYKGYESIARDRPLLLVGCWMHARRYFVKAFEAKDMRAAVPIDIIKKMYAIERASKEAGEEHDARFLRRQRALVPLLDQLEEWLQEHRDVVVPKSNLGKAIGYADNHWDILRVVEKDGALELDNGDVERVIRGPAIGRRNWLFAGSDAGGERAAIILTVIETAARAGIDLRAYVHDILVKLSSGWKMSQLDELLPENWIPATDQPC